MRPRLLLTALMLLALVAACSDEPDLAGVYHEQPPGPSGFPDDQWFAMGVDMFHFDEEVGGIVRYYSLKDPEPNSAVFDPENERFCFWVRAPSRLLDGERQLTLDYKDIHWPEQVDTLLELSTDDTGNTLKGGKIAQCNHPICDPTDNTEDARCNANGCVVDNRNLRPDPSGRLPGIRGPIPRSEVERTLNLSRVSVEPRNTCEDRRRYIVLELKDIDAETSDERVLQIQDPSGVLWSDINARRFTYAVAWAGDDVATYPQVRDDPDVLQPQEQGVELPFIIDWYRRAHDTAPALQRVAFDRWLPPGFWTLDRGEGVKVGDRAKILVGTYFFYYESQSNFNEPRYDSTAAEWNPALDDIVATPFVASEEPNALEGTVVVWIEGRPSLLPNGIKALFPDPDNLREGYSLWDAVVSTREAGEIIRFKKPSNGSSLVRLYVTRQIAQYRYPEHTELSIARLPVAVD